MQFTVPTLLPLLASKNSPALPQPPLMQRFYTQLSSPAYPRNAGRMLEMAISRDLQRGCVDGKLLRVHMGCTDTAI